MFELSRIIKKDGFLILGTPDYSRWSWVLIEKIYKLVIPGGYTDEYVTHYTRKRLVELLELLGFNLVKYKYILDSDLICKFRKVA
ncbi:MAG: hypothetical protein NT033_03915, partial [Candidatus Omnitrophica bacterium]|nr:hypothetical protein [Candidatus Omnitrophota bacterium]